MASAPALAHTPTSPTRATRMPAGSVRAIALLLVAAFTVILNETIMSVALPQLMVDLSITAATAQWLSTGFLLTMAVVIPVTGVLQQRFSTRQVFLTAMALFFVGTVVAALAPGFGILLLGRIIQATGTALTIPLLMTTVMTTVPPGRRGSVMGLVSIVISVAPALGPTISGLILEALNWRWLFGVMIPIVIVAFALGALLVRSVGERRPARFDALSVILSALGFGMLIYGLSSIGEASEGNALISPWIPVAVGAVALALFTWRQLRLQDDGRALLDLRPFRSRTFSLSLVLMLISMAALFGTIILLPLYLQNVLGLSTLGSGLVLLPGGLLQGLLSPFVGRLYDRVGVRPLIIPGTIIMCAALWLFTTLSASTAVGEVIAIHMLLSLGLASLMTPLMTSALGDVPRQFSSHASAILNTVQQLASAAGTAVFIAVMTAGTVSAAASGATAASAQQHGVHVAFVLGGCIAAAAIVISCFVGGRRAVSDSTDDAAENAERATVHSPEQNTGGTNESQESALARD